MRDELSLLQVQLAYKKRLVMVLKELYDQQRPLVEKVARLEKIMKEEQKDVERLESRSLAKFFYYITGQIDEKLDAERRESYAARVKYDAACRELKAIEEDIENTREDLQDLADCEERYAQALENKRQAIAATDTQMSAELIGKEQTLAHLQSQERELEEAIMAGTAALRVANEVATHLRHAEELGEMDLLGGGFFGDMARHETLDEAQKAIEELQVLLQKFNKELADVEMRGQIQVTMDTLLKFADLFLDNLLTDNTMLERITESLHQIDQTRDRILGILRQLQTRLEEVRHRQGKTRKDVDELILKIEL